MKVSLHDLTCLWFVSFAFMLYPSVSTCELCDTPVAFSSNISGEKLVGWPQIGIMLPLQVSFIRSTTNNTLHQFSRT